MIGQQLLAVMAGGVLGASLRFVASSLATQLGGEGFPWGTLTVNLIGSFVIGFLWAWLAESTINPVWRTFIFVGVLGSFTTFSSFTLDGLKLLETNQVGLALLYMGGSNLLGLLLVYLGVVIGRQTV